MRMERCDGVASCRNGREDDIRESDTTQGQQTSTKDVQGGIESPEETRSEVGAEAAAIHGSDRD